MSIEEPGEGSALIDLEDLSLIDLARLDHPVLVRALHRALADAHGPDEPLARFESSV